MAQSFYPITPVDIGISGWANDTWTDIDLSSYLPAGATGAIFHIKDGQLYRRLRFRKKGSTDDRQNSIYSQQWLAVGVDGSRVCQGNASYYGKILIDVKLVGYTVSGVTMLTNGVASTPAAGSWTDVDCSATAPDGTVGLIFEVTSAAVDEGNTYSFGVRKNGSTDNRTNIVAGKIYAVIGCDASRICEAYVSAGLYLYLVGYITDGATFNTNATDISLSTTGSWTDLSALPATSIMGVIEVISTGESYGLRKNGSGEDWYDQCQQHAWGVVECDGSYLIEGKISGAGLDFFLVGYADAVTTTYVYPSSIGTAESFGTPLLLAPAQISPTAIESAEAFGTATVIRSGLIEPSSITSEESFGTPTVALSESDLYITPAQKKSLDSRVKAALNKTGKDSYTYYNHTGSTVITKGNHNLQAWSETATITLDNSDQALNDIALKGYDLVLSFGLDTPDGGIVYEKCSKLYVIAQRYHSARGKLLCDLICIGQSERMLYEQATTVFIPTTETCRSLINSIAGSFTPYSSYQAIPVHWDSTDSIMETFAPGSSFRIYIGTSRLAAIKRLLEFTSCVMNFDADGEIHIFVPTTTGSIYDYEYKIESGYHQFYSKVKDDRIILPNLIKVTDMADPHVYTGEDKHQASIDDYREVTHTIQLYQLASSAEASAIASAVVDKMVLNAKDVEVYAPMNCLTKLWDYTKVTDAREGTEAVGNVAWMRRYFAPGTYAIQFGFGGGTDMSRFFAQSSAYSPNGSDPYYHFSYMEVDAAYIKNLQSDQIDMTSVTIDTIGDGSTYKKTLATQISAGKVLISSETEFAADYNPTEKFDMGDDDLDDVPDGTTYKLVQATDISGGHIKLTTYVTAAGKWYSYSGVDIDAGVGITLTGELDLIFTNGGVSHYIYGSSGGLLTVLPNSYTYFLNGATFACTIKAASDSNYDIGEASVRFAAVYADALYYAGGSLPDEYDDLELIKQIKTIDGTNKLDTKTLPSFVKADIAKIKERKKKAVIAAHEEARTYYMDAFNNTEPERKEKVARIDKHIKEIDSKIAKELQTIDGEQYPDNLVNMMELSALTLGGTKKAALRLDDIEKRLLKLEK